MQLDSTLDSQLSLRKENNNMEKLTFRMTKFEKVFRTIGMFMLFAAIFVMSALAGNGDGGATASPAPSISPTEAAQTIGEHIAEGGQQVYGLLTTVMIPVMVVFVGYYAIKGIFGGDRGMEQAKTGIFRLILIMALVYLAPVIITTARSWFGGFKDGTDVWTITAS